MRTKEESTKIVHQYLLEERRREQNERAQLESKVARDLVLVHIFQCETDRKSVV